MPILRTSGVNYEPTAAKVLGAQPLTAAFGLDPLEPPDTQKISTLHLSIDVRASMLGEPVDIYSARNTCGSGCRAGYVPGPIHEVEILRFAKQGHSDFSPPGIGGLFFGALRWMKRLSGAADPHVGFKWLITMEDGYPLKGTVGSQVLSSPGQSGELRLGGRMVIVYQPDNGIPPVRLLSRKEPILSGSVSAWPPRGATLKLENSPIEYFRAESIDDPEAVAELVVESNTIEFGEDEVSLLRLQPQIDGAEILGENGQTWTEGIVRGLRIAWTDTRALVDPADPPVRFYHVYRRIVGDDLNQWMLVKTMDAAWNSWTDTAYDGRNDTEYLVLHAALYNFDYHYESLLGTPVRIPAVMA